MTTRRSPFLMLILLVMGLSPAAARGAQDPLARAKDFYASAAYEEALKELQQVRTKAPATEVAAYQVFCLLALGRTEDATAAIQAIVRLDPLYHPNEAEASPRVRAFFEQVRRPLLPDIVRQLYARAKTAFQRKDMPVASTEFDRVVRILDDLDTSENDELADLRTLAGGFRELSKVVPAPPPPLTASGQAGAVAAMAPATPALAMRVYGPNDVAVVRPLPIARVVPRWRPTNATEERLELNGSLELVISETGTVLTVSLTRNVHPRYDPALIQAARDWTFKPATLNGVPVKYRYTFDVKLGGVSQ